MSTICKIAIESSEEEVLLSLTQFLENDDDDYEKIISEWALVNQTNDFEVGEYMPTIFSVKQVTDKITEIHYNSFSKVVDLVSYLTKKLTTKAVVNIYQSTAEACYWAYYLSGEQLREIESGDGEIGDNNGIKLDFENDILGHNISDVGEEPFYIFGSGDMEKYNEEVDIRIGIYLEGGSNWVNYKRIQIIGDSKSNVTSINKPWWKFWW